jgi:hypothetical protein
LRCAQTYSRKRAVLAILVGEIAAQGFGIASRQVRIEQAVEVEAVVLLGEESCLPVIAPLDEVLGHVREIQSRSSVA